MKSSRAVLVLPALVLALFTVALSVNATPATPVFTQVDAPFVGVRSGAMAWGDYDNDGYLDLIVTGDAINAVMVLYHNNGDGTFTAMPFSFAGHRSSSVAWGDFDNDGYLDLLVTGLDGSTEIYHNLGGTNFVEFMQFPSVYDGQVKWGDMDNDGWLDFAITGAGPFSQIYHSVGGTNFVLLGSGLTQLYYGSVDWADFDHDGNLDLLLTGMSTSPQQNPEGSYLYRNEGNGHFTSTWFLSFFFDAGQWLDFDNDGWADLALQSWSSGGLRLYRNNRKGSFNSAASLPMWLQSVGDFNNDGWSDLLIGGQVFQNSGIGLWPAVSSSLPSFIEGAACGDFNNDGKLDLVAWGQSDNGYLTYLYRNDVAATNLPPTPPGGLYALATRTNVVLSWDAASDDHQKGGLTYNLRVGTTPGGSDVVSPMSAPNGFRRVVRSGNTGGLTQSKLCGLRAGTRYFWSVQAIDNSFAGSAFAAEKSFVATAPPTITGFTNFSVLRDSGPIAVPFVVGDSETPASNLVVAATSSNVQLVAPTDLATSGTDADRTLEITPEAGQTGTAIISVTVTDGDGGQASQAFQYTVVAACMPTPNGLVSWWRGEGSTMDAAGTNDGSGPVAYQAGEAGNAFYENGSSWVSISPSPGLDVGVSSGFTFEAWINPADLTGSGDRTIVAWVVPGFGPGILFALTSNTDSHGAGALHAVMNGADLHNVEVFSAGGILTTGAYQHVAFTYDKSSGVLMIFCNGVVVAQDAVGTLAPNTGGALVTLGGSGYSGSLDELSIYNRALSTSEIWSIYRAGSAGKCFSGFPPEITAQPQSQFAWSGAKATFSVAASSSSTLSYQWRKNGADIAGAATSEYTIGSVQPSDAGLYSVLVGNRAGAALSSNAGLTVQVPGQPPSTSTAIVGWGDPTWGSPAAPAALTNVLAIAAGGYHSLALTLDGKVVGFGNDYYGQSSGPAAASNVVAIAAGWLNSFVVNSDGTVAGWGDDSFQQTTPPPGLSNVVAVAAGGYTWGHTLALKRDGSVVAWGTNSSGEIDVPAGLSNVIAIAAGDTSSLVLRSDGTLVGWGTANVPAGLSNVIAIACGAQHSLALENDGTVVAWGSPNPTSGTEVAVGLSNVVGIAAGAFHSLALKRDGTVVGWGWNDYSQTRVPAGLSNVVALAAGALHSIALVNNGAPWLLWEPRSQATFIGLSAAFSAVAVGGQPLSYQWQLDGTNIDGATASRLVLTNLQSSDAGSYSVVVGNTCGSVTSHNAALGVSASSPILVTQPADQSVLVGSNVVFAVAAAGTPSLTYQWQFNGADISGETNAVLLLPDAPAAASGRYTVVVSNSLGCLASREALLNVYDVPRVISQPVSQTVVVGARAVFAAQAQSLPPLEYQWRFNGTNIPGATNSVFTINAVQFSDTGVYQVWLNNPLSSTSSIPAVLTVVDGAPVIVTPPVSQEAYLGGAAVFGVVAGGTPPLAYQWLFEGTNIAGATNSLLAFSQVAGGQAGRYSVVVSNAFGRTQSTDAALVIGPVVAWGYNSSGQTNEPPGLTNTIAIVAGYAHNLALKSDGTVVAWGDNNFGQCSVPPGLSNIVAVAAGDAYSLALRDDGTVVGWGGLGSLPVPNGLSNVVTIAGGSSHSLALKGDGTVVAWGANDSGQASVPSGLSNVIAIAGGVRHSLALKSDGTVVAWGSHTSGETTIPKGLTNIVAIAAGLYDSVALRSDGIVTAWGYNVYNESTVPAGLTNAVAIAAGYYHCLAITSDGSVVGWGYNGNGQTDIPPALHNAIAIGAGWNHSLALFNQGPPVLLRQPIRQTNYSGTTVAFSSCAIGPGPLAYQWQFNGTNIAGATNALLTLTNIQPVHAGAYSVTVESPLGTIASSNATLAVVLSPPILTAQPLSQTCFLGPKSSNITFTVSVAGSLPLSYQWQLNGTDIAGATGSSLTLTNPQLASRGLYHVVATNAFGVATSADALLGVVPVVAWGLNGNGQTNVPPAATNVVAVAGGQLHCLAMRADATVLGWGSNAYGLTNAPAAATNVVGIAAGASHNLALRADGTVIGWGYNNYGQINVPSAATNVVALAAGSSHSLALKADGTVIGWGYNNLGQINVPSAATNVVALAAGSSHSLALKADGKVIGWGYNNYGQINVPSAATNVIAIAAGWYHSLALRADGSVLTWGSSSFGLSSIPAGATNVVAIAAGGYHSLALRADGILVPWGDSSYGLNAVPPGATNAFAIGGGQYLNAAVLGEGNPRILSQPWNRTVNIGATLILAAPTAGASPLAYQWRLNGAIIPGATRAAYTISPAGLENAGSYTMIASNTFGAVTSAVAQVTVNRLPLASDVAAATRQNQALDIPVERLLLACSDPDDDLLSLSSVSTTSTNGGRVSISATNVSYTPATNFIGADRFTYTVTDGRGGFASAYVLVTIRSADLGSANMLPLQNLGAGFQVTFCGIPGTTYRLQRAPTVNGPWTALASVTAGLDGIGTFPDTNAPPTAAYYRTIYP